MVVATLGITWPLTSGQKDAFKFLKVYNSKPQLQAAIKPMIEAERWSMIAEMIKKQAPLRFTGAELESVYEMSASQKKAHIFMMSVEAVKGQLVDIDGQKVDVFNRVSQLIDAGQWKKLARMAKSQASDIRAILDPHGKIRVQSQGEFAFRQMLPSLKANPEAWKSINMLRMYGQWERIAKVLNESFKKNNSSLTLTAEDVRNVLDPQYRIPTRDLPQKDLGPGSGPFIPSPMPLPSPIDIGKDIGNFFVDDFTSFFTDDVGGFFKDDVGEFFTDDVGGFFKDDVGGFFKDDVGEFFKDDVGEFFKDDVGGFFKDDVGGALREVGGVFEDAGKKVFNPKSWF